MAIKLIKFDLPINGTKVTTLEALRDNLTDEIVELARSGQLERWFKSRQLQEQAKTVINAVSLHIEDKALFLELCTMLDVEVHIDDINAIFDAPSEAGRHIGDLIECKKDLEDIVSRYNQILFDLCSIQQSFIAEDFDVKNADPMDCTRFLLERIDEFAQKIHELILEKIDHKYPSSFDIEFEANSAYINLSMFTGDVLSRLTSLRLKNFFGEN